MPQIHNQFGYITEEEEKKNTKRKEEPIQHQLD